MSLNRPVYIYRCLRCTRHNRIQCRTLTTTTEPPTDPPPPPSTSSTTTHRYDPNKVHRPGTERRLIEQGQYPIGSRRRRAAIASSTNIPFSQLPYQCFQEARAIIQADRATTIAAITRQRERIARCDPKDTTKLNSLRKRLEELKVQADINDPLVKKRFEDGLADMDKPIYRHLADVKWREYERRVLMQRITQMDVVPDILPTIDPVYAVSMKFGMASKTAHGEIVHSLVTEQPPVLTVQSFESGERKVTVVVVNPDVPDVASDAFKYRCHFLAKDVVISPTKTKIDLGGLQDAQVVLPWLPPYVQKGLRYQRHAVFVLEQPEGDMPLPQGGLQRDGFILKDFVERHGLQPKGVDLFRAVYDDGTAEVMSRAGIVGADVEFKRKRVEPLPYQRLKGERFR